MMGLFEKFTLCCVVIVITSLSCILVASVQLMHRLEDGVNRDNGALLRKLAGLRLAKQPESMASPVDSNPAPLLVMIIRSAKQNYALRRTIRRTWAREDHRLEHRFVLRPMRQSSRKPQIDDLDVWLERLHRRETNASRARYFLLVNESVFVNTRFLLDAIERVLPTEGFVLCSPVDRGLAKQNLTCDPSNPILVSADVVRGETSYKRVAHDGRRLYLNRHETEALVRQQIDDGPGLTFFFTASLQRVASQKTPLTQLIDRLWLTTIGNYTPVEY